MQAQGVAILNVATVPQRVGGVQPSVACGVLWTREVKLTISRTELQRCLKFHPVPPAAGFVTLDSPFSGPRCRPLFWDALLPCGRAVVVGGLEIVIVLMSTTFKFSKGGWVGTIPLLEGRGTHLVVVTVRLPLICVDIHWCAQTRAKCFSCVISFPTKTLWCRYWYNSHFHRCEN